MSEWLKVGDHRIKVEEIIRYSKAIGSDSKFNTEIEMSSGNSFFIKETPEQLDKLLGLEK